jgi:hypothetical protein
MPNRARSRVAGKLVPNTAELNEPLDDCGPAIAFPDALPVYTTTSGLCYKRWPDAKGRSPLAIKLMAFFRTPTALGVGKTFLSSPDF